MESNGQPDERHDDMLRDDESIEVVSESGESHIKELEWSIYSAGRSSIAGSDGGSINYQKLSIHSKMAKFVHHDGRQFIERRDLDDGGLPYSAEFYLDDEVWKLSGEDCILMSPRRFIAVVSVEDMVDLEEAEDFNEAVRKLLKYLKVVNVFMDKQMEECNKGKSALEVVLDKLGSDSGNNIDYKRDVMLLRILLQKHGNSLNMNFKNDLKNCSSLSSETMSTLDNYVTTALKLIQRNQILGHMDDSSLSDEFINDALQKALTIHRDRLAVICPSSLKDKLEELHGDQILYVTTDDMNLFADLTSLDLSIFGSVLPMIFSKFLKNVQEINGDQLTDFNPKSNRIFQYVCKSLQEVVNQLGTFTKSDNTIIYSEDVGWEVTTIQEKPQNSHCQSLRQQLQMLAALANHFEPYGPFRTSCFPYEFKLFQNMDTIPEQVRIWMCLLDDCMKDLVQADIDKMQMLSCFFKSYVSFIASEDFRSETLECLRTITHDALRSLTDMQSSCHRERTDSDSVLLEYNEMIGSCLDEFTCEHFGNDCEQIQETLRRIIGRAMSTNVASDELTKFSRLFEQLLQDISDLPLEWFIQLPPSENRKLLLRGQFVVPVENRWKDTEYECLEVVDPEGFIKMFKILYKDERIPKHYHLKAIQVLLDRLTAKQISYDGKIDAEKHILDDLTNMINSIRNRFLYLSRQPDHSCFEDFLQYVGELSQAMEERRSLDVCDSELPTINVPLAVDSPRTDPIGLGKKLDPLPDLFEGSISKEQLTKSFEKYSTQFDNYIRETAQLPREKRIGQVVSDVFLKVKPQGASSWTEEFKRNELPEVLAGLSAVWSFIVSKNGSNSEKLVKPTSLQICCILSFFGDQSHKEDGIYKLLYIATQQGKDLVLGLTSALLALYGHKVLIACYNSIMTRRNSIHLLEVFKTLAIEHDISYGSIEDFAREQSREDYEKYATYVHESLGLEKKANYDNHTYQGKRSVLLIEDIDLFLQSKTLGQVFQRYIRPTIPGLALIQGKYFDPNDKFYNIDQFIDQSNDPDVCKLRTFLARPQMNTFHDRLLQEVANTNKALFITHVKTFIKHLYQFVQPTELRLSENGVMMVKTRNDYRNVSNISYFALKMSDFQQTVKGYKNYGFLTLGYIPFPYAHLLKSFPLVFGFASVSLNGYEEFTISHHYDINHKIAQSNPLPTMPVRFDSTKNFLFVNSTNQCDWLIAILVAIKVAIERNCSVLVFFQSVLEMDLFLTKLAPQLKRLNVTAIETASNGEHPVEDDIAVEEVTLLVIERNGDLAEDREVHVIQTFFSDDAKEEDLIRRQAERNHGNGSYELIVSRSHVSIPDENKEDEVAYDLLVKLRTTRTFGNAVDCLAENMKTYEKVVSFYNEMS